MVSVSVYHWIVVLCFLVGLLEVNAQWMFGQPKSEGEHCGTVAGVRWTCKKESVCPYTNALRARSRIITCSTQRGQHVICCPPPPAPTGPRERYGTSISERKCQEYQSRACEGRLTGSIAHSLDMLDNGEDDILGDSNSSPFEGLVAEEKENGSDILDNSRDNSEEELPDGDDETSVYNGEPARAMEFPHMVAIGYQKDPRASIVYRCGGTLISETFVLSAAHCSTVNDPPRWALLGDLNYTSNTDDTGRQIIGIDHVYIHREYNKNTYYNDIALFRLKQSAVFDEYVAPACLLPRLPRDVTTSVTATGYGKIESHLNTDRLMKVNLNFVPTDECIRLYQNEKGIEKILPSGINARTQICASFPNKDTCEGDSGGPLQLTDSGADCLAQVLGITSFGPPLCGTFPTPAPGVYVNVAAYLPWIENIVWPIRQSG